MHQYPVLIKKQENDITFYKCVCVTFPLRRCNDKQNKKPEPMTSLLCYSPVSAQDSRWIASPSYTNDKTDSLAITGLDI